MTPKPRKSKRKASPRIIVHAIRRDKPDFKLLAQALIELSEEQLKQEALAEKSKNGE